MSLKNVYNCFTFAVRIEFGTLPKCLRIRAKTELKPNRHDSSSLSLLILYNDLNSKKVKEGGIVA